MSSIHSGGTGTGRGSPGRCPTGWSAEVALE